MKLVVRVQVSADGKYSGFPIRDNRGREHLLLVLKVTFAVDPASRARIVMRPDDVFPVREGPGPWASHSFWDTRQNALRIALYRERIPLCCR